MDIKKLISNTALLNLIFSGAFYMALTLHEPVHAARGDLGTDVAKYQPQLTNNSGNDKFSIAQVGGSVHGYIYDQAPYSDQIYQGQNMGYHMHNYIWLETGANQEQTKQALDYFLKNIKTPYGSNVALDYESGATNDKEANTANVIYGMQLVKQAGFIPKLYGSRLYLKNHLNLDEINKLFINPIWVAGYQNHGNQPNYNYFPSMDGVSMWQFNDKPRDLDVDLTGDTENGYTQNTNVQPSNQPIAQPQPTKSTSKWYPQTYVVKSGDTLSAISAKVGDSVATLEANNNVGRFIYPGQKLLVNNFKHYNLNGSNLTEKVRYVQSGDSLNRLSYLIGDSKATIVANNPQVFHGNMYSTIYPGQSILFYR